MVNSLNKFSDSDKKRKRIRDLLSEDAEKNIFGIVSYAVLKNHYRQTKVYFGYNRNAFRQYELQLFRTWRMNASDNGIDFVMRPAGRIFRVKDAGRYDEYLRDIDSVNHFPITFVVKTNSTSKQVLRELFAFIRQRGDVMRNVEEQYRDAIEEIITINELRKWLNDLSDKDVNNVVRDLKNCYREETGGRVLFGE